MMVLYTELKGLVLIPHHNKRRRFPVHAHRETVLFITKP